eukprot:CAMPEP_0181519876 /NCGR_PEP_ID=MMETSP1110-20121109/66015_1 /TAXON_ID=174948 /ORGANISM="Symbiodinium sp., Strain CCMP421" /LENGTH=87 /DNA_ID=CAMNT_0023650337 /DNA_START=95 /DNA_END=358 /DNA_ORIENTATION=-
MSSPPKNTAHGGCTNQSSATATPAVHNSRLCATAGSTPPIRSRAQLAATETKVRDRKRAMASSTSHMSPAQAAQTAQAHKSFCTISM